jgi:hypothetical protein
MRGQSPRSCQETVMELLINIDVDDLPRGIGFYQAGLGLL